MTRQQLGFAKRYYKALPRDLARRLARAWAQSRQAHTETEGERKLNDVRRRGVEVL